MNRDNPNNILGINSADNQFSSASVASNADGSIIERIEYLQSLVGALSSGSVILQGKVDAAASSTTVIPIADLAGYGNDFFNNQFYLQVLLNANSATNAPEKQTRKITDYVSATGTFTCDAFSAAVEANDLCVILHESQVAIGSNNADNVFDSSTVVSNTNGSVLERLEHLKGLVGGEDSAATILGANNADNGFESDAVVANADGSVLERLEQIQGQVGGVDGAANVLGANDDNNVYDSGLVVANEDGSVLERLEQVQKVVNKGSGTAIAANKSLVDALGTNGTAVTDSAVSVLGAIGANNNNNAFDSATVVANEDGSVLERLEQVQKAVNNGSGKSVAANKSLVDALGSDGTAVVDSAVSVLGAIGANNANNAFDSSTVVANVDGSVLERLEHLKTMSVLYSGTLTTSSATVPADTTLGAAIATNNYYNGCILMPLTGASAFQPRKIINYAGTTGVMTLDTETPFAAAPGTVAYVILADTAITGFNVQVPATPTAGSLYDILSNAAGGNTFDKATDSLEAISDKVTDVAAQLTQAAGLYLVGTCTTGASATSIAATELAGFGNKYFSNKYYMMVIKDAGGASAAPELQIRKITDYTSTTGVFTVDAFANNVDVGDELAIIHETLIVAGRDDADNVILTSSVVQNKDGSVLERLERLQAQNYRGVVTTGASATEFAIAELAGFGDDYFNNKYYAQVVLNVSAAGTLPENEIKKITDYVSATGTFTCDAFGANVDGPDEVLILHESQVLLGRNDAVNTFDSTAVVANEDGSVLERLEQVQEAINNGTGTALTTNRSIVDEIKGSALNYDACNYLAVTADLESASWNEVATQTAFVVTGLCRLRILIECTETCVSNIAGGNMKFGYTGATDALIVSTSIDALAVGELWIDDTPTEQYGPFASMVFDVVSNGINIGYEITDQPGTDGTIVFHCWWEPLNATGAVVAGVGQALA